MIFTAVVKASNNRYTQGSRQRFWGVTSCMQMVYAWPAQFWVKAAAYPVYRVGGTYPHPVPPTPTPITPYPRPTHTYIGLSDPCLLPSPVCALPFCRLLWFGVRTVGCASKSCKTFQSEHTQENQASTKVQV